MNTNETINAAHTVAIHMLESNAYISQEDTICAVRARSGRIFTGASHMNVHAEVEAVQNMLAAGDSIIDEFVLISTHTRVQLLPCNNCISYIMSIHPENVNAAVLMPDRAIRMADVGMFTAPLPNAPYPPNGAMYGANQGMPAPPPVNPIPLVNPVPPVNPIPPVNPVPPVNPMPAPPPVQSFDEPEEPAEIEVEEISASSENTSSDLLKKRVNSLLRVASDEDEEIDRLTEKKKRFGFFRK
jgi:cytidine deaminase